MTTTQNHAPVGLGAGSYDYDELSKALGTASKAKPEDYDAAVREALDATEKTGIKATDPRDMPGHKFVNRTHTLEGSDTKVTERIQVFADAPKGTAAKTPSDAPRSKARSTKSTGRKAAATAGKASAPAAMSPNASAASTAPVTDKTTPAAAPASAALGE